MADTDPEAAEAEGPAMRMICPACNRLYEAQEFVCKACGSGLLEIPDAPLLSGRVLDDRYDLDAVVGTGGMGTVYRARQRGMEREVAVKILHAHYAHQPRAVKRFFREAQAASRLVHPNIVTVYDFGRSTDGHLFMVMEMLEGWTLGDLIHYRAPLKPALAIAIATQICDALEEAHRRRLVHRDLKPDNVLLTTVEDGLWAKVLDFGIARAMRDPDASLTVNQSTVEIAGTPSYMSPEQILGKEPDPRSDLYALGIILFEMLTKRRPFDDESSVALCMKHLNEVPPRLSSLAATGRELDAIVASLLEKGVEARPQSAREVRDRLLACPESRGPLDLRPLEEDLTRALSRKTTRADAALLMVQPTLDSAGEGRGMSPALGAVIDRAKEHAAAALSGLADLHFVELPPARPGAAVPPPLPTGVPRVEPRRRRITAVAHVLTDHPAVLKTPFVAHWIEAQERQGVAVSVEPQKAILRSHGERPEDDAAALALVRDLVALQAEALRANVALRAGVATVSVAHGVAEALDLSRRLAASGGHGVVSVPRDIGPLEGLDARQQSAIFLAEGTPIECMALRAAAGPVGAAPSLLWGRSLPLLRLGQIADEARRAGPGAAVVVGARGVGRTALVKAFAAGRTHLFVRVAPGAAMWPGHTAASLVAATLGLWPLGGRPEDLSAEVLSGLDGRERELLGLLLCDQAAEETPSLRTLARLVVDALARYAGDGPLAVIIDDAHLMDRVSQELLEAAFELAQGRPWCVVATARWLKPGMFLASAHRVDLRPLSLRASNAVLDALGVGPRQRHALMAAAGGNPLALHLLARAADEGRPLPPGDVVPVLLPDHLRTSEAVTADRAWVAAALGDPRAEDLVTQAARLYLEAGLSDTLAAWLVERLGRVGPVPRALAAHWTAAHAQDHVLRAERCERLGLWRHAALEYETAVALLSPEERGVKQLRAAQMRARAGDIRGAIASWDASLRAGVAKQRPTELLAFAGALLELGERERATQVLEHLGASIDPVAAPRAFAEAVALKARAAVRRGDLAGAMGWLQEARGAAEALKRVDARAARSIEAQAQEVRAEVAVAEGDRETARVNMRQARDTFRDLGRAGEALRCLNELGRLELEGDMAARARDTFQAATRLATASGFGREAFRAEVGLGESLAALGEVDEGAAVLRQCLRRAGEADEAGGLALAAVAMARVLSRRGLWADAQRYVERARSTTASPRVLARAWACEGEAWVGQGQARRAAKAFQEALAFAKEGGDGLLGAEIEVRLAQLGPLGGAASVHEPSG